MSGGSLLLIHCWLGSFAVLGAKHDLFCLQHADNSSWRLALEFQNINGPLSNLWNFFVGMPLIDPVGASAVAEDAVSLPEFARLPPRLFRVVWPGSPGTPLRAATCVGGCCCCSCCDYYGPRHGCTERTTATEGVVLPSEWSIVPILNSSCVDGRDHERTAVASLPDALPECNSPHPRIVLKKDGIVSANEETALDGLQLGCFCPAVAQGAPRCFGHWPVRNFSALSRFGYGCRFERGVGFSEDLRECDGIDGFCNPAARRDRVCCMASGCAECPNLFRCSRCASSELVLDDDGNCVFQSSVSTPAVPTPLPFCGRSGRGFGYGTEIAGCFCNYTDGRAPSCVTRDNVDSFFVYGPYNDDVNSGRFEIAVAHMQHKNSMCIYREDFGYRTNRLGAVCGLAGLCNPGNSTPCCYAENCASCPVLYRCASCLDGYSVVGRHCVRAGTSAAAEPFSAPTMATIQASTLWPAESLAVSASARLRACNASTALDRCRECVAARAGIEATTNCQWCVLGQNDGNNDLGGECVEFGTTCKRSNAPMPIRVLNQCPATLGTTTANAASASDERQTSELGMSGGVAVVTVDDKAENNNTAIVLGILGGLLAILVVLVAVYAALRWRERENGDAQRAENDNDDDDDVHMHSARGSGDDAQNAYYSAIVDDDQLPANERGMPPTPHSINIDAQEDSLSAAENRYDYLPSSRTATDTADTYVDITTQQQQQQQRQYGQRPAGKTGDHYVSVTDAAI